MWGALIGGAVGIILIIGYELASAAMNFLKRVDMDNDVWED